MIKKIKQCSYAIIICLLFAQSLAAQKTTLAATPKKAIAMYDNAYKEAVNGNFIGAINLLTEALKIDNNFLDALLARADLYARIKNYKSSIEDYEAIQKKDNLFVNAYLLNLAISHAGIGNFEKALATTNYFLQLPNISAKEKENALKKRANFEYGFQYASTINTANYVFNPINMGDSINTIDLEYLPSLTVDGNTLIFNRRIKGDEDFYQSDKLHGVWQKAIPLPGKINTNFNEGAQNISQDGKWLIFTGCNYPEGMGSCDLYIAYKNDNGQWGEAENLGRQINTDAWESSPSLSPDKSSLYFASTRLGGFGGSDIWVSKLTNEQWQAPENLGPIINTGGDEGCPFIHADNQTLYFNSSGLLGYGNTDLFVTTKSKTSNWQTPKNLGYPINTIDNEGSMIVAADGKTAYYASDFGTPNNKIDLYSFTLREDVQAKKTIWVKGKIVDKKTNVGLSATVNLILTDSGYALSNLITSPSGSYLTTLPVGNNYTFSVNKKGYLFFTKNFLLTASQLDTPFVINIALQPIEKGASIILQNIFFANKSASLQPSSFDQLNNVAAVMTDNPSLIIQINGYTDNVGKPADNVLLSLNRCKAIITYLSKLGINTKRLLAKGFGEAKPIQSNNTEVGKAQNRRIEMQVVSN